MFYIIIFILVIVYLLNDNITAYDRRWKLNCYDLKKLNLCNKKINNQYISNICPKSCNKCKDFKDFDIKLNKDWGKHINPYEGINCNTIKYNNGGCNNWLKKYCKKTCCEDQNTSKLNLNCKKIKELNLCNKNILWGKKIKNTNNICPMNCFFK